MNCETTKSQCCCGEETDQQKYDKIAEIIDQYKNREGSLIQVLHVAQTVYGYLPMELLKFIAKRMDIPLSEVSGVSTFYPVFSMQPRGKHTIKVCMGTACYVRGGKKLVDRLENLLGIQVGETSEDRKYNLEVVRCLGACGLAPAMMIDETIYKQVKPDKLNSILAKY
ncbi:NADH-quinone oxidoreductase subunit NuoE [Desulfosporosinus shakirovi]|uniref:NADH-quinone oxidoreductase subunit NuoE n=1 Tax=Desulfosporosinus shakirovi TaxID=2885154 RepID=UPI001E62F0CF|nr:NADH-quinone oxidoreductase subunit NuoE [Desulfosporosinus sp. SRJS8]MCB8815136.1 NADH-quinone oxidoreductase subunit NuoE [Desulfosporosinus sp. SRJS8]